jgi:hypothetical protein
METISIVFVRIIVQWVAEWLAFDTNMNLGAAGFEG